jgi:SAM-dependent methyltransferase
VVVREFDLYRESYNESINKAIAFSGQTQTFHTEVKARYLLELFDRIRQQKRAGMVTGSNGTDPLEVLDVGCGQGLVHQFLRPLDTSLRLTGVDVAGKVIDEARQTNPFVHYDIYEGGRLPYAQKSFDAAFAIAVMHHVPPKDWAAFDWEMRRVVRRGGYISVIEHNPINPLTQWVVNTCRFDDNAVLLRSGRLARLLREAGLVDVERRFILFTPFGGIFFRALEARLNWLPLGAQYCVAARVPA